MSWLGKLFARKPAAVPNLWDGRVLSQREFAAQLGAWEPMADSSYAVINSAALPAYYTWFRERLRDLGIMRWDEKFDCDNFARLYCDLMAARFYGSTWESGTTPKAESPSVAGYWYVPGGSGFSGHAIAAVATERGLLFIEPQTGAELQLTDAEKASRYRTIA